MVFLFFTDEEERATPRSGHLKTCQNGNMTKPTSTQNLMHMLSLTPVEPVPAAFGSDEVLSGVTLTREQPRTFGGQVLAQSIMAADRTVEGKTLHSIHAYFLRPGDIERELLFATQRLNDSRSFSTRRVQVFQEEAPMFSAIMSFQSESRGPEHTAVTMPEVPDPESLPKVSDYLGELPHPIAQAVAWERPIDMHHVDAPLYTQPDSSSTEPRACVWFKTFDRLVHADGSEASEAEHRAAIAYLPLEPALRRHGKFWLDRASRAPRWITQCGSTARLARTSGYCTCWIRRALRVAVCSRRVRFSIVPVSWWRRWRRK